MKRIQLREILGRKVVDSDGVAVGHLEEIEAERGASECVIQAYIVEHHGLLDRVSTWALTSSMQRALERNEEKRPYRVPWDKMDLTDPAHPKILMRKRDLTRTGEDPIRS